MLHKLNKFNAFIKKQIVFIDIPNEKGIYEKWLICDFDYSNQFPKYSVLPCEYRYHWIAEEGSQRVKYSMWGISRSQSSYNSGIWVSDRTTAVENQDMFWLPLNPITEYLFYTHPVSKQNQRLVVSAPTSNPIVWKISKVIGHKPFGIQKLTLFQDVWNPSTDYIDTEAIANGDTYAMYADYYTSDISPTDPTEPTPTPSSNYGTITASTSTIKIGGSYKTLTMTVYDENGTDITDTYSDAVFNWTCSIEGVDDTELDPVITWLDGTTFNKQKIKFSNDRSYLEKILEVKCEIIKDTETIETTMQFELIV